MMEILQILKYTIRAERLDFTKGLLATEADCSEPVTVIDVQPAVLADLLMAGDVDALVNLINSSYK